MDGQRFDGLTRELAGPQTRRHALRLLAGGTLGAVLARFGLEQASAQDVGTTSDAVCEGRQVICSSAGGPGFDCAEGCVCARNTNGEKQCVNGLRDTCRNRQRCDRNKDCNGDGQVCIRVSGCDCPGRRGRCFDRCATP